LVVEQAEDDAIAARDARERLADEPGRRAEAPTPRTALAPNAFAEHGAHGRLRRPAPASPLGLADASSARCTEGGRRSIANGLVRQSETPAACSRLIASGVP